MDNQYTTTILDIVNIDKALAPVMAYMARAAPDQLKNSVQSAVGAALSGKCCSCVGRGYCPHDYIAGAKEGQVAIIANAEVAALQTSSIIFFQ